MSNKNLNNFYNPKISIVILNWNGFADTIDCLISLSKCTYSNFDVILIDNNSNDESVSVIKKWLTESRFQNLILIENKENYGFAKGNNIGIDIALKNNSDFILLLNNDTVVESDFLIELLNFYNQNNNYLVLTPQIRYFNKPNVIWNCGGKLSNFGTRKYFYNDTHYKELPNIDFIKISFITGCSIMINSLVIKKIGKLSENYFFGEEDFEFSMRLKKNKINAACVLNSKIFHKVNSSISKTSELIIGKIFINYLCRFIDMRTFMSYFAWHIWRRLYTIYIFYLLKTRYRFSIKIIHHFISELLYYSVLLKGVDKSMFEKFINNNFQNKSV